MKQTKLKYCLFAFLLSTSFTGVKAQEIDFGTYSSVYSVTISPLSVSDLEFGTLINSEGMVNIPLSSSKVLTVEGVRYLDVIVTVTAEQYLLLDDDLACETNPSCRLEFTLNAAYANRGVNSTSQATVMTGTQLVQNGQFQIRKRGNAPPGPPPTPVYEGYNPALFNDTAYLYIYGSVDVGDIDSGAYSSDITVMISYD